MKFLCSILILAGVLAINDAFPSFDDQMRLENDKLIMEELERMADDRAASNSAQCSSSYLTALGALLDIFNEDLVKCNNASETEIAKLKEDARAQIEALQSTISSTCENTCSLDDEVQSLNCIEELSSKNSRSLQDISVKAATDSVELKKNIDNAVSLKAVCEQAANSKYSSGSMEEEAKFKECVNKKEASQ